MFVSFPKYEFTVPINLGLPGAKHWRALGLSVGAAWFALTVRSRCGDRLQSTTLFAWDSDVVDALANTEFEVESLLMMFPAIEGSKSGFTSVSVKEVWEAICDDTPDERRVLFLDSRGEQRSGMFLEPDDTAIRTDLIVRIGD